MGKMQVTRIGWVAPQSEGAASSERMRLPRHVIMQRYFIDCAVWWSYLQVHSYKPIAKRRKYKPIAKRRKRQFFRMKNSGDASAPLVAGRCLPRVHCAC